VGLMAVGQFPAREPHVSPLTGLPILGLEAFPPLTRWATICRPSGAFGQTQFDLYAIQLLDRREGGAV